MWSTWSPVTSSRYHTIRLQAPTISSCNIKSRGRTEPQSPRRSTPSAAGPFCRLCSVAICQGESLFGHLLMRLLLIPGREHLCPCPTARSWSFKVSGNKALRHVYLAFHQDLLYYAYYNLLYAFVSYSVFFPRHSGSLIKSLWMGFLGRNVVLPFFAAVMQFVNCGSS